MTKMPLLLLLSGCLVLAGPAQAGNLAAGKEKSEVCGVCHGDTGKGEDDVPAIAGKSVQDITNAIKEYQSGVRTKSRKMTNAANKLNDEDIADLATYYSTLPK